MISVDVEADNRTITQSIQLGFAGVRVTGVTEYPDYQLTRDRIQAVVKSEWQETGGELSMAALQNIAGRITALYRQAGFVFTRAYIPQQKSTDGIIEIRLLEGFLEAVDVYDNENFDRDLITAAFQPLIGKVIHTADVESAMALTNDLPGLNVFGFYSVGEQLGGTRINLRVREEKSDTAAVRVDNHGSRLTGEDRVLLEWEHYNLLGTGDSLRLAALQTFDPSNATYGLLDFRTALKSPRSTLGIFMAANDYVLGRGRSDIGQLDITGETHSVGVDVARKFRRSSADTRVVTLGANWDESRSRSDAFPEVYEVETRSWDLSLSAHFDLQDRKNRTWRTVGVDFVPGHYTEGNPANQPNDFWLARVSERVGRIYRPFENGGYHKWIIGLAGQYSDNVLPPDEQLGLGGVGSLRGFEAGQFSADSGVLASSEWFLSAWHLADQVTLTPSFFMEYGYGVQRVRQQGLDDDWAELADLGAALSLVIANELNVVVSVAQPVTHRITYSDESVDDWQFYAEMTWRFF